MSAHPLKASRRRFLRTTATAAAMIPLVNLLGCSEEPAPQAPAESPAAPAQRPSEPAAPPPTTPPADPGSGAMAAPAAGAKLEESDPTAQALGYRHSAEDVDQSQFPRFEAGHACANCSLYLAGQSSDPAWGGCSLFPGKLVNAQGWCNAYVAKA